MALTFFWILAVPPLLCSALPSTTPHVGISIPLSKRTPQLSVNGVVDRDFLNAQVNKVHNKIARGFAAYKKNTGKVHPSNTKHITRRSTGADALQDDSQVLWQGTVQVGTPAVNFTVDFDTGSSDFFLPGPDCDSSCDGHTIYNTSSSSSAEDQDQKFSLAYGDGSTVEGNIFTDTFTIAGLTGTNQSIGAATTYSSGFSIDNFQPDGLVGMAFKEISDFGDDPVFQTLVSQGVVTAPEFAFELSTSGAELFLGGVNTNKFTGSFTTSQVSNTGFWQISMDSANVDGEAVVGNLSAIIDTGTTLIIGDTKSVSELYDSISGSKDASQTVGDGYFTVPCDSIPNISLTFGGKAFSISADTFNVGQAEQGSSDCIGGIVGEDVGDAWVVGDVFLQNVYTSFNVENETVGFASLA
ncbi:acid protease [Guyanagaster necrorhizus]|uniref:Acid protease n=1 Tax=Guyanagaster necrorhizus TaxID=856835 RepID=A0A9P7VSM6_9AGAR|nr:acid protease [Guyanagaster necrorhizus MCA 3950]KAG7445898.1 acid protease [Guyanagaster necrorhizus MCA 3950]